MTEQYDFSNDKFTKMLGFFSIVEAYGLIYPGPSGENSGSARSSAVLLREGQQVSEGEQPSASDLQKPQ